MVYPVKIGCFIDSLDPGGAETVVTEICREVKGRGYRPEVLHFGNEWLEARCHEYGIDSVLVPDFSLFKSVKTLPLFALSFARFLKKRKIDIIHSHLFGAVSGAALPARLSSIPHIGTLHDTYTIAEKKGRAKLLSVASRLGSRLVTVSDEMRVYLEGLSKFPAGAIEVIHNGVSLERYKPVDPAFRESLGVKRDEVVFTCVGRLVEIKNHAMLIEAFAEAAKDANLRLLIVGDGPEKDNCARLITEKGIAGKATLLGHRDDIPMITGISDCFVLASRSEGLSCSIIEAMASGLPVVATNVGGNPELIAEGKSGYLVPVDDCGAMAQRMKALAQDEAKRKAFGKESRRIVEEDFSIDAMVGKYVAAYKSMLCPTGKHDAV